MKVLALLLLFALQATLPPEAYPGQSDHREPPAGWTCQHQNYDLSIPPDHACGCERSCDPETGKVVEDRHCFAWCWPGHCGCGMSNMKACQ